MRILSWFFGKRETTLAAAVEQKTRAYEGQERTAIPPSDQQPAAAHQVREAPADLLAENVRRWRESGQPRAWVEARQGRWDHDAWLALLDDLKQSSFWPMNPDAIGLALEDAKREWLSRN